MAIAQPMDPSERVPAPAIPFEPAFPEGRPGDVRRESSPIAFEPVSLRPRHDGWTADKQIAFIEALVATRCVDEACRRVGMSDTSAYELRNRTCGAEFRRAWDLALELQLDRVEQGAVERSINGVPRPIFYKGEQVGEYRHYDERLTMFLLRHRRPARYGRWIDYAPPAQMTDDERRYALGDALTEIAIKAPARDGNPIDEWAEDRGEEL